MATNYEFVTKWQIRAPLEQVWDAIHNSMEWPDWWKGVVQVKETDKGGVEGIGGVREYTWRSVLPYKLAFHMRLTEIDKYKRLKGEAFGELEGIGEWFFEEKNEICFVQYNWTVITNKAWMNYLSFMLKPAFNYNHDVVMRWGAEGLAKKLHAQLISHQ
ncbi:MAG: hypothetical protein RLZZ28_1656 [Bacteroidota bacterium]